MLIRSTAFFLCFAAITSLGKVAFADEFPASSSQINDWTENKTKSQERNLANSAIADETMLSPQLIALRNSYLNVKTAAEMDAFLTKLENQLSDPEKVKAMPLDEKLYASILTMSVPLKSLVYLVSADSFWSGSEIHHSAAITLVKSMAGKMRISSGFFQNESSPEKAGFDYLTQPVGTIGKANRFKNATEFQNYLCTESTVTKKLVRSGSAIQSILADWRTSPDVTFNKNNRWIIWDNQMLNSSTVFSGAPGASRATPAHRYMWFGKAELTLLLSGITNGMAQLHVYCSYNSSDFINVGRQFSLKMGADGAKEMFNVSTLGLGNLLNGGNSPEYGLSDKQAVTIVKSFPRYLTQRDQSRMGKALSYFQASNNYSAATLSLVIASYPENDYVILNRKKLEPFVSDIQKSISLTKDLLEKDEVALVSESDYEKTKVSRVSLKNFFLRPPADLKAFLPNPNDAQSFDNSKYWIDANKDAKNYYFGRIVKWNNLALETYVLTAKGNPTPEPLIRALKTVSQFWGVDLAN